ncbi:hypothetical protein L3X38_024526 [Prunus dulcis]|uniref:Integrase catalytic domain-containing protein n=1 Tax=Prunus dulcis TaxID=3755 RepID=A0AAD4W131_PRUDU|nr:hypothetical protein L3X38_024526 [Prunus dulcis]
MVETHFHTRIQVLRSDNGGEFLNHDLNQFLQDHGIIHQRSCLYTSQQNGVAERKNRHLLEVESDIYFSAVQEEDQNAKTAHILEFFPSNFSQTKNDNDRSPETLPKNDQWQDANDRSPETLPENDWSQVESGRSPPANPNILLQNDRSPEDCNRSSPGCQTKEEKIEEFLPAQEYSSAPVPHQSLAEDVIQVTAFSETDNINEIAHDDLISEGTEPAYQIPKRKNRGKPQVHYEADLNANGKYLINNYVSINRLSESRYMYNKWKVIIIRNNDKISPYGSQTLNSGSAP